MEGNYFDIILPFYSLMHTSKIKIELNLSPMIQFKFKMIGYIQGWNNEDIWG